MNRGCEGLESKNEGVLVMLLAWLCYSRSNRKELFSLMARQESQSSGNSRGSEGRHQQV